MSFGSLSGHVMVMSTSAFMSMTPVFAVGLISENAVNTMKTRPSRTLNRMSVNGTKVPSSLPDQVSDSSIAVALERRYDMHFGEFGNAGEQFADTLVEVKILQLQK